MNRRELIATSMLASARRTPIPFEPARDSWARDWFLRREEPAEFTGLNVRFAAGEEGDEASIWVVKWGGDKITQL